MKSARSCGFRGGASLLVEPLAHCGDSTTSRITLTPAARVAWTAASCSWRYWLEYEPLLGSRFRQPRPILVHRAWASTIASAVFCLSVAEIPHERSLTTPGSRAAAEDGPATEKRVVSSSAPTSELSRRFAGRPRFDIVVSHRCSPGEIAQKRLD